MLKGKYFIEKNVEQIKGLNLLGVSKFLIFFFLPQRYLKKSAHVELSYEFIMFSSFETKISAFALSPPFSRRVL